jgi:hypothetical protein
MEAMASRDSWPAMKPKDWPDNDEDLSPRIIATSGIGSIQSVLTHSLHSSPAATIIRDLPAVSHPHNRT